MAVYNVGMDVPLKLVILGQTGFEIFEELIWFMGNSFPRQFVPNVSLL